MTNVLCPKASYPWIIDYVMLIIDPEKSKMKVTGIKNDGSYNQQKKNTGIQQRKGSEGD